MNSSIFLTKHNYNSIELFYCEIVCTTIFDNVAKCIRTFSVSPPPFQILCTGLKVISELARLKKMFLAIHARFSIMSCNALTYVFFKFSLLLIFLRIVCKRESHSYMQCFFQRISKRAVEKNWNIFFKVEKLSVPQ